MCTRCGLHLDTLAPPVEAVIQQDVTGPDATQQDVAEPDATQQDVTVPTMVQQDVAEPQSVQQDVAEPDVIQGDVAEPDVVQQDSIEPTEPQSVQQDSIEPTEPQSVQQDVAEPDVVQQDSIEPRDEIEETPTMMPPEPAIIVAPLPSTRVRGLPVALALVAVLVLSVALAMVQRGNSDTGNVTPTGTSLATMQPSATFPVVAMSTTTAVGVAVTPTLAPSTSAPSTTGATTTVQVATEIATLPPSSTPPSSTQTNIPAPAATYTAVPPSSTPVPPSSTLAPTNTNVPTATPTRVVPPTPIPQPTAMPQLPAGSTVRSVNGWTVNLIGADTRDQLSTGAPNVTFRPNGTFWLVRIDARNDSNQPRSPGRTTDFVLRDGLGNLYPELSNHGTNADMREIAVQQGFSYLSNVLPPGGSAATLLIFDLPRGAQPKQLVARIIVGGNSVSPTGQVTWNLGNR